MGDGTGGGQLEGQLGPVDPYLNHAEKRVAWYTKSAWKARISYQALEVFQIGTGAAIPLAAAVHWPIAVGATLGACIAIAGGLRAVFRWQANWIAWTVTTGKMYREIALYKVGGAPYDGEDPGELLVRTISELELAETLQWAGDQQKGDLSGRGRPEAPEAAVSKPSTQ